MNFSDIIGVSIPVVAIVMGCLVATVAVYFRAKRYKEAQETIRLALEKGIDLPEDLLRGEELRAHRSNPLWRGVFWTALGLSLIIALYINEGLEDAAWGLIPLAIGVGSLIYHKISKSDTADDQGTA